VASSTLLYEVQLWSIKTKQLADHEQQIWEALMISRDVLH